MHQLILRLRHQLLDLSAVCSPLVNLTSSFLLNQQQQLSLVCFFCQASSQLFTNIFSLTFGLAHPLCGRAYACLDNFNSGNLHVRCRSVAAISPELSFPLALATECDDMASRSR